MSDASRRTLAGLAARYEDDPVAMAILEELARLRREVDGMRQREADLREAGAKQLLRSTRLEHEVAMLAETERWTHQQLAARLTAEEMANLGQKLRLRQRTWKQERRQAFGRLSAWR